MTEEAEVKVEEKPKVPIIKDVDSALDKFKKTKGWLNIEPKINIKPKKFRTRATNKSKPYNPNSDIGPNPISSEKVWELKEEEWDDEETIEDEPRLTKAEFLKRQRDEELELRRKQRQAAKRDQAIYNALLKNMNKEIYYPLFHGFGWMLVSKLTELNVTRSKNAHGFQPYEVTQKEKVCALTILHWDGEGPEFGTVAKAIQELGCPTIYVINELDVKEILRKL